MVDIIFETIKYLSFSSMPLIAEKNSLLISHADIFVDSGLGLWYNSLLQVFVFKVKDLKARFGTQVTFWCQLLTCLHYDW